LDNLYKWFVINNKFVIIINIIDNNMMDEKKIKKSESIEIENDSDGIEDMDE
jgi:hypothetical protein